jgi:uncharacterized membrane-anchored protein YitT (DUF2179 family)
MFTNKITKYINKHQIIARISAAFFYGIIMAIAMNFFWKPGNIFSSGFTGLAQLVNHLGGFNNISLILVLVNIPMTLLAWYFIGNRFAFFEILAIIVGSIAIQLIHSPEIPLTNDPLVNAIFGGALNGVATGISLRRGVATGGLDILSVFLKKYWNIKMFPIATTFNAVIMIGSGISFGWKFALYSIIGVFISSWVSSALYTRQQQMQVMIVTDKKEEMVEEIQSKLRRGITVINGAEGGYLHDQKNLLFTVITLQEMYLLKEAVENIDKKAFVSVWKIDQTFGRFYEHSY